MYSVLSVRICFLEKTVAVMVHGSCLLICDLLDVWEVLCVVKIFLLGCWFVGILLMNLTCPDIVSKTTQEGLHVACIAVTSRVRAQIWKT